jgi:quercetin dioxygenase-like cupin family protein
MGDQRDEARHGERHTHGSGQRAARQLDVPLRTFDVPDVAEGLRGEPAYASDGRNAQTVHDDGSVRVMVGVVSAGGEIGARESDGHLTITLGEGRGMLRRGAEEVEVAPGRVAILAPGEAWAFAASEPSVLVATFWAFGEDTSVTNARTGTYTTPTHV